MTPKILRFAVTAIASATALIAVAETDCYVRISGDTLSIGNSLIERNLLLSSVSPSTISLIDNKSGLAIVSKADTPDFAANREAPASMSVEIDTISATSVADMRLEAIVTFKLGALDVKRVYSVTNRCPAIACATYLRGSLDGIDSNTATAAAADRQNIEHVADMAISQPVVGVLDRMRPVRGKHWHTRVVEFHDVTDWNNNLVETHDAISYRKADHRGNLLFVYDGENPDGVGFFMLKEAPCSDVQLHYGKGDFVSDFSNFAMTGLGVDANDLDADNWTKAYTAVIGVWKGSEAEALSALRAYHKSKRIHTPKRDEMVMMNTWGDRSQDAKVNHNFCLAELEKGARLGISHFQIDDGWQKGKSPNSAVQKGSFENIWERNDYWQPDPQKYPKGLKPIVDRGKELGIQIGLWFNPSVKNDFSDWDKDAATVIGLWREYGICVYKIDGVQLPTKRAETNFRHFLDSVDTATNHQVVFNLDVTAGRRGGYNMLNEYGNIFLENRYTDWGNYYPYMTLRNLWQLSRYVAPEMLQIEFLNNWRNADKYPVDDRYAPSRYELDYLFAITMAAQPLAWMEASNLPDEAYTVSRLIKDYRQLQHEFHNGVILPIGNEPSGHSITGFQSIVSPSEGYMIIFREDTPNSQNTISTWLPEGAKVRLSPAIEGYGYENNQQVAANGNLSIDISNPNNFIFLKYEIE